MVKGRRLLITEKLHTFRIKNYSDIWIDLRTKSQLYNQILLPSHCVYSEGASHAIYEHIIPEKRLPRQSPIIYLKSVKNAVEIEGMKRAHVKDGAAMCDFFAYIEAQVSVLPTSALKPEEHVMADGQRQSLHGNGHGQYSGRLPVRATGKSGKQFQDHSGIWGERSPTSLYSHQEHQRCGL